MDICGALVVRLLSKAVIAISDGAVLANGAAFAQGAITNGANHEGTISVIGEVDEWSFTANQGDALVITLGERPRAPDPNFWPWLRVTGPTGTALVCGNCWGDQATRMAATAPLTGTYPVLVSSQTNAVGDYVLRLARTPSTFVVPGGDEGGAMTNGANHAGRIELADLDMWSLTANQGDALVLSLGEVPVGPGEIDPNFWPWLRLYTPTGAALTCGNCWGALATDMAAVAPLTGTYTVVVASQTVAAGDYILRLARSPAPFDVPGGDEGGPMSNGATHVGRIELADLDIWSFTAIQGAALSLRIDEIPVGPGVPDPGFWPWIRVFGPTGSTVVCGNCWGNTSAQMNATAPATGSYTVVVASQTVAAGDYRLVVNGAATPVVPTTVNDSFSTNANTTLNIAAPGVLANDNGNGGGTLTAQLLTATVSGTLSLAPNGGFIYSPNGGFIGSDSFTYRAVSAAGLGNAATVTIAVNNPTSVQPPTALYASSIQGNRVTLRWTPPASGAPPTGYVIEGGVAAGQTLASLQAAGTTPLHTFVAPTGAFYVRVHTVSGANRSIASNEIRIFVNVPAPPSAPADLIGLVNGSAVALAWRNTFEGGAPGGIVLDVAGPITRSIPLGMTEGFQFNGVPGGAYTVSVRAVNSFGSSTPSNSIVLTFPGPCSGPPLPPSRFLAHRVGRTLHVVWDPAASGPAPTSFVLNVSGAFSAALGTPARTLSGTVGPGTYHFSVLAANPCGSSDATAVQTVVVP